jgi:hypothetical protein
MSVRTFPLATVTEDDSEQDEEEELNENEDLNENKDPTTSMKIVTASEKLNNACFGIVIRNSCKQVNCEYSLD